MVTFLLDIWNDEINERCFLFDITHQHWDMDYGACPDRNFDIRKDDKKAVFLINLKFKIIRESNKKEIQ